MESVDLRLDGNAIGGLLGEIFAVEMTAAVAPVPRAAPKARWPRWSSTRTRRARSCAARPAVPCSYASSASDGRIWLDARGLSYLELRTEA